MIRVFVSKTSFTPVDKLAFVGEPGLFRPENQPVKISVNFSWDIDQAERLYRSWSRFYEDVELGGPAFSDPGFDFVPGRFVKTGIVFTSRGCPNVCDFCLVPKREGDIRELPIVDGYNVADNNLLACSDNHIREVFDMLRNQKEPAIFSGGLDARIFRPWHAELLKSIRLKYAWFACDSYAQLDYLRDVSILLADVSQEKKRCYVLIGRENDTIEKAESRLKHIYGFGFLPMAMLYRGDDSSTRGLDSRWNKFARSWIRPAVYRTKIKNSKLHF